MVKLMKTGNILYQEGKTFDLVEISLHGKEIRRMKGSSGNLLEIEALRYSRHSFDDMMFPWIKSNSDLTILNCKDFSVKDYKGIFGKQSDSSIALLVVCSQTGDKILTVTMSSEAQTLQYFEKGNLSPTPVDFKTAFPRRRIILYASRYSYGS